MKLVFIRHADPDYPNNTLTEKGFEEIKALKKFYDRKDFKAVFCSPLNRAILTCEAIKNMNNNYEIKEWLMEFPDAVNINGESHHAWDFPEDLIDENIDSIFDVHNYEKNKIYKNTEIKKHIDEITFKFDQILEQYGYKRKGSYYIPIKPNDDTLLFVCHLGIMSVLISHLFNCTYINVAEYFAPAPCSVTTLISEERKPGLAHFRASTMGDVSHLLMDKQKPSKAGRGVEYIDKKINL